MSIGTLQKNLQGGVRCLVPDSWCSHPWCTFGLAPAAPSPAITIQRAQGICMKLHASFFSWGAYWYTGKGLEAGPSMTECWRRYWRLNTRLERKTLGGRSPSPLKITPHPRSYVRIIVLKQFHFACSQTWKDINANTDSYAGCTFLSVLNINDIKNYSKIYLKLSGSVKAAYKMY